MGFLLPLASLLGIEVEDLIARAKRNAIAWTAVAAFALLGVIFILVAIANASILAWGPVWGPLAVAAGAIVIALIIWASIAAMTGQDRRRAIDKKHANEKTALVTTAALTALPIVLQSPVMRKVGIPVGGALAALFFMSRSSRQRHARQSHD
jgi:hypothetical protein